MFEFFKKKDGKGKNVKTMKVVDSKAKNSDRLTKELSHLSSKKELKVGSQYVAKNDDGTFTVRTPYKGSNTYSHGWNEKTIVNQLQKADYFEDVKRNMRPKQFALSNKKPAARKTTTRTSYNRYWSR